MFEKLDNCPLCQSGYFTNHIICQDFTVSHENFVIVRCDNCNFHFTNPRPASQALNKYYDSDQYVSHQNKSNSLINIVYKFVRQFTLRGKLRLISKYFRQGSLLDIGCGTGHFLKLCHNHGWKTFGVEPSDLARRQATSNNISVAKEIYDIDNSSRFDVITMWHVLEHIPDIQTFLNKTYDLLSKKGTLIVAVPNVNSLDAQIYKQYWAAYDVPRHLYHFGQATMKQLMKAHGFKITDTKPMKLDAYYVSLLSQKHQNNGKNNYVRSIINGYKSNSYARKNKRNYSSLIYILKKS